MQPERMLPGSTLPILSQRPYVVRLQDDAAPQLRRHGLSHHGDGRSRASPNSTFAAGRRAPHPASSSACSAAAATPSPESPPIPPSATLSDLLVRAGATVMFSEVTEVRDAIHLLTARATSQEVADGLIPEMAWYDSYLSNGAADRSANPTPGNKRGGLTNIVEKALGSIAKSGTSPISAVFGHGEHVTTKGLVFAATPASDFVCGTLQLAAP